MREFRTRLNSSQRGMPCGHAALITDPCSLDVIRRAGHSLHLDQRLLFAGPDLQRLQSVLFRGDAADGIRRNRAGPVERLVEVKRHQVAFAFLDGDDAPARVGGLAGSGVEEKGDPAFGVFFQHIQRIFVPVANEGHIARTGCAARAAHLIYWQERY